MTRTQQTNVRLTEAERRRIERAAQALGLSVSEYLRQAGLDRAAELCPACGGSGRVS